MLDIVNEKGDGLNIFYNDDPEVEVDDFSKRVVRLRYTEYSDIILQPELRRVFSLPEEEAQKEYDEDCPGNILSYNGINHEHSDDDLVGIPSAPSALPYEIAINTIKTR